MSLTNRLRSEEESIVLRIWVVHFKSFGRRTVQLHAIIEVVKFVTHDRLASVHVANLLSSHPTRIMLELAISLVK